MFVSESLCEFEKGNVGREAHRSLVLEEVEADSLLGRCLVEDVHRGVGNRGSVDVDLACLTAGGRERDDNAVGILSERIIVRRAIADENDIVGSEEHTSELQSLMRNSYAVFCLKKKKTQTKKPNTNTRTT